MHPDIPFILDETVRFYITLDVMGIHGVGSHAHRLLNRGPPQHFFLGHDKFTYHPACFTHIDLVRPVAIVDELVLGQSPP